MAESEGRKLFLVRREVIEQVYVMAKSAGSAEDVARNLDNTEWAKGPVLRDVNIFDTITGLDALEIVKDMDVKIYTDEA